MNMQKLMVNDTIDTVNKLQTALLLAEVFVSGLPRYTPFLKFEQRYLKEIEAVHADTRYALYF